MKKILFSLSVMAAATLSWSQTCPDGLADSIPFNIVIRDFQPLHPDFENFDDRWKQISTSPLPGYTAFLPQCFGKTNPPPADVAQVYMACEDGYPCGVLKADGTYPKQTIYGEYRINNVPVRGHRHAIQRANPGVNMDGVKNWEDPVWVTRGMVQGELLKVDPNKPLTWIPVKKEQRCNNTFFDQWYTKNDTYNKTIEDGMFLKRVGCTKQYRIDSKEMPGGAYFPLDKYHGDPLKPNWGKESLKLWCPPYGPIPTVCGAENWTCGGGQGEAGPSGSLERDVCTTILANGGPRTPGAVMNAVQAHPESAALLHNYAFTMMGYNTFTYSASDTFLFSGDDDMWIFLDGKLVADLGGTHLPAEARVAMKDWGDLWGWKEGETHDLHFFYADRQTDGSNLMITTTLGKVGRFLFGAPKIERAEPTGNSGEVLIYVTNEISDASVAQILKGGDGSGYFPILDIKRSVGTDGSIVVDTMGVSIYSFEKLKNKSKDDLYVYKMTSKAFLDISYSNGKNLSPGDSLAFNFKSDVEGHKFMAGVPANITSTNGTALNFFEWGVIGASQNSTKPAEVIPPINTVNRPEMNPDAFGPGSTVAMKSDRTTINVSKIPMSAGNEIPNKNMGEVTLALLPAENLTTEQLAAMQEQGFGAPPSRDNLGQQPAYIIDETRTIKTKVGDFTYNQAVLGPTSATDGLIVSRCSAVKGDEGYDNSCLGVSFVTERPFTANVMVYDHLGNFVSRYTANVDSETLTKLQGSQPATGASVCVTTDKNTQVSKQLAAIKSGKVLATINVYPFSQTGRKIGTGVYLLKVDIMQKANEYCVVEDPANPTTSSLKSLIFSRAFSQIKLAYKRSTIPTK